MAPKVFGTPQSTGIAGHAEASIMIADAAIAKGNVTDIYFNMTLSKVTGNPSVGNLRPDVILKYPGPLFSLYEVPSLSQTEKQMDAKGKIMTQKLANLGISSTCETVTVRNANAGNFTVRGLGALSIASPIVRALELSKFEKKTGAKVPFGLSMYFIGGYITIDDIANKLGYM